MSTTAPLSSQRNNVADFIHIAVVLMVFCLFTYLLIGKTLSYPYGLAAAHAPELLLDAMMQAFPLIATILSLLIVGVIDRRISRMRLADRPFHLLFIVLSAALIMALLFLFASYLVMTSMASLIASPGVSWVWLGYAFDLFVLMLLAQFIHALTRRWYLSLLIFVVYVTLTVLIGARFGDVELIGFATTPPIVLSGFTERPIGIEAAWVSRVYWGSIAVAMAFLLAFFDRRPSSLLALHVPVVRTKVHKFTGILMLLLVISITILTALFIDARKAAVAQRYIAIADVLPADVEALAMRATVTEFDIEIDVTGTERSVSIRGNIRLMNQGAQPLHELAFEKAPLLRVIEFDADRPSRMSKGEVGRLLVLHLQEPLMPGESLQVSYEGGIEANDIFDKHARTVVMEDAIFLTTGTVLPLPKNSSCFAEIRDQKACKTGENYMQTDSAPGQVLINAPAEIHIAAARRVNIDRDYASYLLEVPPETLGHFLIAGAKFRVVEVEEEHNVKVYAAPFGRSLPQALGAYAVEQIDFYSREWHPLNVSSYWLVETPSSFTQAVAYYGGVAISEKLLSALAPDGNVPAAATKMVLSHELAHQWWGFSLVPAKGPGDALVLESFSQFAATDSLRRQGLISQELIIATEQRNMQYALSISGSEKTPLYLIDRPDWQAYHQGPLVLAQLNDQHDGNLILLLGKLLRVTALSDNEMVDPQNVISSFIKAFPEHQHNSVRTQLGVTEFDTH
jgi:ABC-2 type transport system permease protein